MNNSIYVFFLILVLLQACNKTDSIPTCETCEFTCLDGTEPDIISNNCIDNWECNFKVTAQSKIDIEETEGRVSGDKNVFQMINSTQGDLSIADDEFTNVLVFELDENQESFSVQDSELQQMNVHYRTLCFCSEIEFKTITTGCMQGEKQADGTWFVQGDLKVSYDWGDRDVKLDVQFVN